MQLANRKNIPCRVIGNCKTMQLVLLFIIGLLLMSVNNQASALQIMDDVVAGNRNIDAVHNQFMDNVYFDWPDDTGVLSGGMVKLWVADPAKVRDILPAYCETLNPAGNPTNRIDIVFVGDGYTADELDTYALEVDILAADFFTKEPFNRYAPLFMMHRIDVISNESGVDNDPSPGIYKDTALDMEFWCGGTERLLCVNTSKAYSYANNAPDVDFVAAIANSEKYGGAGYSSSDLATASSRNGWSSEVLLHEFGHAMGNLADEYNYGGGTYYNGGEVPEPNASIMTESEMESSGKKWAKWLGVNNKAFDGLVSTYEGARYYQYGIYRPTNNSLMNSLGRPFNLPSLEATLIQMYKVINPIDDASPNDIYYNGTETLFVDPVDPVGHPLDIQWLLENEPIPGENGTTLDLASLNLSPGWNYLGVEVVDNTDWVRDEVARANYLTQRIFYVAQVFCTNLKVDNLTGGQDAVFTVTGGVPGSDCVILWGNNKNGQFKYNGSDWCVKFGFNIPDGDVYSRIVVQGTFDANGQFSMSRFIPAKYSGVKIMLQAAMSGTCPNYCMSNMLQEVIQ